MKTKYWKTDLQGLNALKSEIESGVEEMKYYDTDIGISAIHVDDHHGKYIPQILTCMLTDISKEDYEEKYSGLDGYDLEEGEVTDREMEWFDLDDLIEEVDAELQVVVKKYSIVPKGYGVCFGWEEGMICTIVFEV